MTETATLAGGCFWCLEAVLQELKGVHGVVSGYIGGSDKAPTYQAVCAGHTGHAEAVQVSFDPAVISYRELVEIFFAFHDPTSLNRQGPDVGTQYRSAIFAHSTEQKQTAAAVIAELNAAKVFPSPIVTAIEPADRFFPAEAYHRDYYRRNPNQQYCAVMIGPKVAKLRAKYADRLAQS